MPDQYFLRPEVSNSDLTALKRDLIGRDYFDPTEAYAFGSLIDAMITEPHRVDTYRKLIDDKPLFEDQEKAVKEFDRAKKMRDVFNRNLTATNIIKGADYQKVSIGRRSFKWLDLDFELNCRCKWDFFGNISGDIKSTMATSQKQFIAACHHFDYFRSRAWYMDLENRDQDMIIGISKVNFKIFFVPIVRGDQLYEIGRKEYEALAFKWWVLKEGN